MRHDPRRVTKERDHLAKGHSSSAFGCFDIFELLNDPEALFRGVFREQLPLSGDGKPLLLIL
jgi:hypothetical protein